ncbi:hypothetical protein CK219_10505 [Mesorhizobium sp. WSM4313]|nr:hypothetical protein CK219_10505 [Mesorhizobium sp. WSM4313]
MCAGIVVAVFVTFSTAAFSETVTVVIETRIKEKTLSFEAGMKSTQTLKLNFDAQKLTSDFSTGVTNIAVTDLKSVRDKFVVEGVNFTKTAANFIAKGQTASGVLFMPDIDYKFSITVDIAAREVVLSGCHDGYPSYKVLVNNSQVYDFDQEFLGALLGTCDTDVGSITKNF